MTWISTLRHPWWTLCICAGLTLVAPISLGQNADDEAPTVLGAPAAFDLTAVEEERVTLTAGAQLREAPAARAPALALIDVPIEATVLERRDAWVRIRFDGLVGWVSTAEDPDQDSTVLDALPEGLRATAVDPSRIRRALAGLRSTRRSVAFGGYTLWTDHPTPRVATRLVAIGGHVDAAFARRYGIEPPAAKDEVIVLFADETAYDSLAADAPGLEGLDALGHAWGGVALLGAGSRPLRHLEPLLVHEMTHLVTRRALGRELPIWLDEGLAEDLGNSRIADDGDLLLGTLNVVSPDRYRIDAHARGITVHERVIGGGAARQELKRAWAEPDRPRLRALVEMSTRAFLAPDRIRAHYAVSGFLVRYLLDDADPTLAAGFRSFLDSVSRGGRADAASLANHLGRDWDAIEAGFGTWVRRGFK